MNRVERENYFLQDPEIVSVFLAKISELDGEAQEHRDYITKLQVRKMLSKDKDDKEWCDAFIEATKTLHIDPLERDISRFKRLIKRAKGEYNASKSIDLDQIKQIPIDTLIGAPTRVSGQRGYYKCPLHSDSNPSFIWYKDTNTWRCWSACGIGGSVIDLYMALNLMQFKDAIKELNKLYGTE